MTMNPLTMAQAKEAQRLRDAGYSEHRIADRLNRSYVDVYQALYGSTPKSAGVQIVLAADAGYSSEKIAEIVRFSVDHGSHATLHEYSLSPNTLSRWRQAAGVGRKYRPRKATSSTDNRDEAMFFVTETAAMHPAMHPALAALAVNL